MTDNIFEITILGLWNDYDEGTDNSRISVEFNTGPDGYNTDLANGSTNLDGADFNCECETITGGPASH